MLFPLFSPVPWSVYNVIEDTETILQGINFLIIKSTLFCSSKIAYVNIALELFHLNMSHNSIYVLQIICTPKFKVTVLIVTYIDIYLLSLILIQFPRIDVVLNL